MERRCPYRNITITIVDIEVEVEVNLRPTVSRPVCPGVRRPSGTCDQFFFLLEISFRQLRLCYFVAPSLTRGRVCNFHVQLLLGLARAVTLVSKSRRTHGHILLSHLRLPQPEGQVPVFISPRNRVAQIYPRVLGFLSVASYDSQELRSRYSNPPPHRFLDIIHRPVFYLKLNTIGLSVPHRKHLTSPLRAQQVNSIYRFVTMVY
jgi:hypothetical protein